MKEIVLYGFGGPSDRYRVIRYSIVNAECLSIAELMAEAGFMKLTYPSIQQIYAVDNRWEFRKDYMKSAKTNSIEDWVIFRDTIERIGLKII